MNGHDPSVAVDGRGNIYYVWIGAKDRLPYFAVSRDGGKKWSKPMMIGAPGVNETNLPTIDVGSPGKIAIAYMGSENSPGEPFPGPPGCTDRDPRPGSFRTPCRDEAYEKTTWNGYISMSVDALDEDPIFYSATANDKRDPLKRFRCGPGRCGQTVLDFIDVVIGPDGTPWAAFADACAAPCEKPRWSDEPPGYTNHYEADGVAGRLVAGASLR